MKAAIYVRVSTTDKGQDNENQALQLRDLCKQKEWKLVDEYSDYMSGKTLDRPGFQKMLADAKAKKFDVLVFWSLDRLTRSGALDALKVLDHLNTCGVRYLSLQEQYLDTCGIFAEAVIAILGTIAKQERLRLSERTKAGLERARQKGMTLGRRPLAITSEEVKALRDGETCISFKNIGLALGISKSSAKRLYDDKAEKAG